MSKPDVAILTLCQELSAELRNALQSRCHVTVHSGLNDVDASLRSGEFAGVIADFRNTSGGGHLEDQVLSRWETECPNLPVIVLADENCPETLERRLACSGSMRLLRNCGSDAILAQLTELTGGLLQMTQSAIEEPAVPAPATGAETVLNGITRRFDTNTQSMKDMLLDLEVAAAHDVTILLIGETGAGKTFMSRLIHEVSPRREEPLITVACGALPAELIESELFGHVKGAFTSAHADKEGKFVAAAGGTILLDEIDVLTPEQQVKLLRVIETGEFEPVGSNQTIKCQARLVVASNLDLQPLVEQGKFRPDLYYRLNMLKFDIAPLRERRADIVPMAHKFITQLTEKHGVTIDSVAPEFYEALLAYPWPGNVRELENVIQRAVIFARGQVLSVAHLPKHILAGKVGPTNDSSVVLNRGGEATGSQPTEADKPSLEGRIANTEREIIEQALYGNNFNRTKTAKALGISRVTLYNKIKKYGIA